MGPHTRTYKLHSGFRPHSNCESLFSSATEGQQGQIRLGPSLILGSLRLLSSFSVLVWGPIPILGLIPDGIIGVYKLHSGFRPHSNCESLFSSATEGQQGQIRLGPSLILGSLRLLSSFSVLVWGPIPILGLIPDGIIGAYKLHSGFRPHSNCESLFSSATEGQQGQIRLSPSLILGSLRLLSSFSVLVWGPIPILGLIPDGIIGAYKLHSGFRPHSNCESLFSSATEGQQPTTT